MDIHPKPIPVDSHIRERALDIKKSFIVRAPAGSGKTELLTKRFIRLLGEADKPEEIVAITFTKKAAAEMKERVIQKIDNIALSNDDPDIEADIKKIIQKNQNLGWLLSENPQRLQIMTIDSFSRYISLMRPLTDFIPRDAKVLEDPELRVVFEQAATKGLFTYIDYHPNLAKKLLEHFHNDIESLYIWTSELLRNREQWLSILYSLDNDDEREEKKQLQLQHLWINSYFILVKDNYIYYLGENFFTLFNSIIKNNYVALNIIKKHYINIDSWYKETDCVKNLILWQLLNELLFTSQNRLYKRLPKSITFTEDIKIDIDDEVKSGLKEHFERLHGLLADNKFNTWLDDIKIISNLNKDKVIDISLQKTIVEFLKFVNAELINIFRDNQVSDYTQITINALSALQSRDEIDFSTYDNIYTHDNTLITEEDRYKDRENNSKKSRKDDNFISYDNNLKNTFLHFISEHIKHLLVDEFQDTSNIQYELLKYLTINWQDQTHSIFFVGDPLQSIYGFRAAEVSIFISLWEDTTCKWQNLSLNKLKLSQNFRSSYALVQWFNEIFSKTFIYSSLWKQSIKYTSSIPYKAQSIISQDSNDVKDEPSLYYHCYLTNNIDSEKKSILSIIEHIKEIYKKHPSYSIAILSEDKLSFHLWEELLKSSQIKFNSVGAKETKRELDTVDDIISLLKSLYQPLDKISLFGWLRSPMVGLSIYEIYLIFENESTSDKVQDIRVINLKDIIHIDKLSDEAKQRFTFAQRLYIKLYKMKNSNLAHTILYYIKNLTSRWIRLTDKELERLDKLLELSASHNQYLLDIDLITDQLNTPTSQVEATQNNTLQLLTIHSSKGLDFDVVFLINADKKNKNSASLIKYPKCYFDNININDTNTEISPITQNYNEPYTILSIASKDKQSFYNSIREQEKLKNIEEKKRLLYVATTRAKKQLHLVINNIKDIEKLNGDSCFYRQFSKYNEKFKEAQIDLITAKSLIDSGKETSVKPSVNIISKAHISNIINLLESELSSFNNIDNIDKCLNQEVIHDNSRKTSKAKALGELLHKTIRLLGESWSKSGIDKKDKKLFDIDKLSKDISENILIKNSCLSRGIDKNVCYESISKLLSNIKEDGFIQDILNQDGVFEYELQLGGHTYYIDYLIENIYEDKSIEYMIIDFKMSQPVENQGINDFLSYQKNIYEPQLNQYAKVLEEKIKGINSIYKIKLMLYFPMLKNNIRYEYWHYY